MVAESDLSKADSERALEAFFSSIIRTLSTGDKISLVGFGTFSIAERAERSDINPSTKKVITIPAKKVAKFKPGAKLTDAIK